MDYEKKYLKYKTKYLTLKYQLSGGADPALSDKENDVRDAAAELKKQQMESLKAAYNDKDKSKVEEWKNIVFGMNTCNQQRLTQSEGLTVCFGKDPADFCKWLETNDSKSHKFYCGATRATKTINKEFNTGTPIPPELQTAYAKYILSKGGTALSGHSHGECPFDGPDDKRRTQFIDEYVIVWDGSKAKLGDESKSLEAVGSDGKSCYYKYSDILATYQMDKEKYGIRRGRGPSYKIKPQN